MTDLPRTTVPATQITHNDLDGYGCSTVVGLTVLVERVEHVTRYADVAPVFEAELERLRATETPELLVVTDIAVEPGFAAGISAFAEMNLGRSSPHLLVVIDPQQTISPAKRFNLLPEGSQRLQYRAKWSHFLAPDDELTDRAFTARGSPRG